jgi:uncharacterized lipoprotein YbaY
VDEWKSKGAMPTNNNVQRSLGSQMSGADSPARALAAGVAKKCPGGLEIEFVGVVVLEGC